MGQYFGQKGILVLNAHFPSCHTTHISVFSKQLAACQLKQNNISWKNKTKVERGRRWQMLPACLFLVCADVKNGWLSWVMSSLSDLATAISFDKKIQCSHLRKSKFLKVNIYVNVQSLKRKTTETQAIAHLWKFYKIMAKINNEIIESKKLISIHRSISLENIICLYYIWSVSSTPCPTNIRIPLEVLDPSPPPFHRIAQKHLTTTTTAAAAA